MFAFVSFELDRGDPSAWNEAAPAGGYSWALAQYQVEFMRFRVDLTNAAHKTTIYQEDLRARAKDLAKVSIALRPDASARYSQIAVFNETLDKVDAFHERMRALLAKGDFGRAETMLTLVEVESLEPTLAKLVADVAADEQRRRGATTAGLKARRSLLWMTLAGTWALTIVWLISVAVAAKKRKAIEGARLAALDAEHKAVAEKEDVIKARSRFLTSISHELRSALQSISSALDLLEQDPGSAKDGVLIGRIKRAKDALLAQLQDLLTLARGEDGKLELHPAPFDARELVHAIESDFAAAAARKGLTLKVRVPAVPVRVVADYTRITQIVTNLVSNAVKYTEQGHVRITLRPYDAKRERLTITVKDTGPGVPKGSVETLFRMHTRLGSVDRANASSGVGLAIVRTVANVLGASIQVESTEGAGTEFVVEIPAAPQHSETSQARPGGALRVLIVDDRADVLESLVDVARHLGVIADTADSAAVAANRLASKKFDLVLIDIDMPGKRGDELAAETRQGQGLNRDSRLIAISAADGRAVNSGWPFNGFIQKPIDMQVLGRMLTSSDA